MNVLKHIDKIREYCEYLEDHIENVANAWDEVQDKCSDMKFIYDDFFYATIDHLVINHDMSKVSHEEFIPYQQKFMPVGESNDELFADAWTNHQYENPHHWQNWTQIEDTFPDEWVCHCVTMLIDWIAMSYAKGGTAKEYYESQSDVIVIPKKAHDFIDEVFKRIYP